MKKLIVLAVIFISLKSADAQVVKLIANPDNTAIGFDGVNSVVWNGSLYTSYLNAAGKRQLAKYNGTTTTLINNPDTTGSIYQYSKMVVFNNAVYFMYGYTYNDYKLAKYDGTSVTLINNLPDVFIDEYDNGFVVYNNQLYIFYRDAINSFYSILVKCDGNSLHTVFAPTSSGRIETNTTPFVYNNKLCFIFTDSLQQISVVDYNGTTIHFSNPFVPVAGTFYYLSSISENVKLYNSNIYFIIGGPPMSSYYSNFLLQYNGSTLTSVNYDSSYQSRIDLSVCNNKLYYTKVIETATSTRTNFIQYNGVNNTSVIANPDTGKGVYSYGIKEYNNKLFFRYDNVSAKQQGGVYDGTSFTLKPNKNNVDKGVTGFESFNNKLYFAYINANGILQIARYTDTGGIYFKNPDSLGQFGGFSIAYNNSLFIGYKNAKGKYQIAYLDSGAATINYTVTGKIITPLKKGINKVVMNITGTTVDSKLSDVNGIYTNALETGNYVLKPTKNNDVKKNNGITSIDVILTQRHILNSTKLNSPYKIIAADVNNDKAISNIDVILMKRLILGIDTTFKGNRLWAFVDSAYKFPDTTNPFPYKDSITFTNLNSSKTNQNFIGVKLGDVNYDWNAALARGKAIDNVQLIIDNEKLRINNYELRIPVSVKNFKDLTALQYTLNFDYSKYEFVGIRNNKLEIEYNATQANQNGNISFLWANAKGEEESLEDGSEVFTLVLKPKGLRITNDELRFEEVINNLQLTINNSITEIEAWDKDNQKHNIVLTKQTTQQEPQTPNTKQWIVSPNPNDGNVVVSLPSNSNKKIVFELNNAVGKTLYKQSFEAVKGNNVYHLNLNKNAKLPSGIYFIKANGLEGESVKRIVVNP